MPDFYKTTDGKVFDNFASAQSHQGTLAPTPTDSAEAVAQRRGQINNLYDRLNKMIKDFNAGNWEEVIKTSWITSSDSTFTSYRFVLPSEDKETAIIMLAIAYAKRDGNYEELNKLKYKEPYSVNEELYSIAMKLIGKVYMPTSPTTGKGKYTDNIGNVYEGEMSNGKLNGMGKKTHKDGSIDEGYFVNGILQKGKQTTPDGFCYEGEFKNMELYGAIIAQPSGKGKAKYDDGVIYEGDFKDGVPHGKGVMTYPDGKVEKGNFKKGEYKKGLFG